MESVLAAGGMKTAGSGFPGRNQPPVEMDGKTEKAACQGLESMDHGVFGAPFFRLRFRREEPDLGERRRGGRLAF